MKLSEQLKILQKDMNSTYWRIGIIKTNEASVDAMDMYGVETHGAIANFVVKMQEDSRPSKDLLANVRTAVLLRNNLDMLIKLLQESGQ